jgi:phage baseplate assembly protein W|tara:strand:- start:19 stop:468 length:450 start_codon:yes stop_codon:yes gene_type:complete
MGYEIISPAEINTNESGLGISFNGGNNRVFKSIRLTNSQALENLKNLLLTRVGERYLEPTFGTQLLNILFEPTVTELKDEISDIIIEPVNFWLPYINIEDIDIVTHEDDPSLQHHIMITISFSIDGFERNSITITANENGTVEIGESNE